MRFKTSCDVAGRCVWMRLYTPMSKSPPIIKEGFMSWHFMIGPQLNNLLGDQWKRVRIVDAALWQ